MRPLAFLVCFAIAIHSMPGCEPPAPARPASVVNVSAYHLTRDIPTAQSYSGCLVCVRLDRGSYRVAGREVRVYGTVPDTPPLLTFVCRTEIPAGNVALELIGRVGSPRRDHIYRTALADFSLTVEDCSVVSR